MTQENALRIMKMGHNIFLSGGAGSGKTYVLNTYIQWLKDHDISVAVTASTGIAATHMHGQTIHAWSGIGIREYLSDYDIDAMESKKYLWDRYEKTQVLIIDEISMLSGNFIDMLDRLCRAFKRNEKPFGGMQVVLSGDLFQLPPIQKSEQKTMSITESSSWKSLNPAICYLTEQHRQDDDEFTDILNAIRKNSVTEEHHALLQSRLSEYDEESFRTMTKLFTHNFDVDSINDRELDNLENEEVSFEMTHRGKSNVVETLKKSCLAPEILKLKIGAEVMSVKNNFEKGYVNGTQGRVVDFEDDLPVIETRDGNRIRLDFEEWAVEDEGKEIAAVSQIPLRHAWAITVHKSQGMSLDSAVIDLSKSFTYGMGYVALSRVRTLSGVYLVGFSDSALLVDPKVFSVDKKLQELSDRAENRLLELVPDDIRKATEEFITRSGGSIEVSHSETKKTVEDKKITAEITYDLISGGRGLMEVSEKRNLTVSTLIGHLEKLKKEGKKLTDIEHIAPKKKDFKRIIDAFREAETEKLTPVKAYLEMKGHQYDFEMLKIVRLFL